MPALHFTLPHWLYWIGLLVFPLVAMALSRRPRPKERRYSSALGYMILVTGGIVGLHRFYLKNLLGLVYLPLFIFILFANGAERDARAVVSDFANQYRLAERTIEREEPRLADAQKSIPDIEAEIAGAEEGSFALRSAERRLKRARDAVTRGEERLAESRLALEEIAAPLEQSRADRAFWARAAGTTFWIILALLAIDAALMPRLVRKANDSIVEEPVSETEKALANLETEEVKHDADYAENWIDRLSLFCGEYVAYWAVIAVFVYYYEVIARYVFNSPTNWAHEAMYLMFGMQYLIAGAYAVLTESHVRVDVFYAPMSPKRKAWTDLITSVFFFIFAGTLLWTSYTFAMDALAVPTGNGAVSEWARDRIGFFEMLASMSLDQWTDPNIRWGEISFNEWEVPLWPMKWVMVLGGLLLVLQGISKAAKDIRTIMGGDAPIEPHGAAEHMREAN
jgi:TRAP-type mannitol/chloroaromatic compound transport system permease small subunit